MRKQQNSHQFLFTVKYSVAKSGRGFLKTVDMEDDAPVIYGLEFQVQFSMTAKIC